MTPKEAGQKLIELYAAYYHNTCYDANEEYLEAVTMAIAALSKEEQT